LLITVPSLIDCVLVAVALLYAPLLYVADWWLCVAVLRYALPAFALPLAVRVTGVPLRVAYVVVAVAGCTVVVIGYVVHVVRWVPFVAVVVVPFVAVYRVVRYLAVVPLLIVAFVLYVTLRCC
jgi:hypothetical protein